MMIAAKKHSGNDVKLANRAAAIAAITRKVKFVTSKPESGTIKIPAVAARAPPRAQVAVAKTSGDHPSDEPALWFSAVADIASPKVVYLNIAHSTAEMVPAISRS